VSLLKDAGIDLESIESLNVEMANAAKTLEREKKEVPEEFKDPGKYEKISMEHLGVIKDLLKETSGQQKLVPGKKTPGLPPSEPTGEITKTGQSEELTQESEAKTSSRDEAIKTLRGIISDLGINYVAPAVGQSLSDEYWLAVDQARAKADEKELLSRVEGLKGEFNEAIEAIKDTKQRREEWENSLGKLQTLLDFSEIAKELETVQKP
jgi:hypothetical protein